jgi:hypothetical protein
MLAAPVNLENVNKNGVGAEWEIVNETTSKGDAWIRQCAQPLLTKKKSLKTEPLPSLKLLTKLIMKVTRGVVSANRRC